METGHDVAIYDLHDNLHTGYIKVSVNKKELTLAPGTQILLTRNRLADFATINPGNYMGYRHVRESDVGDRIKAYICDFSISQALTNVPVVHGLLASNDPAQRDVAHIILKNAAIIGDLAGSLEYSYGSLVAGKGVYK